MFLKQPPCRPPFYLKSFHCPNVCVSFRESALQASRGRKRVTSLIFSRFHTKSEPFAEPKEKKTNQITSPDEATSTTWPRAPRVAQTALDCIPVLISALPSSSLDEPPTVTRHPLANSYLSVNEEQELVELHGSLGP